MSSDAILVLQCVFGSIWSLFSCFEIPGTHTTPAEFAFFALGFALALRIARRIIFVPVDDGPPSMPPLQSHSLIKRD